MLSALALIAATVAASGEDAQAVQELKLSIWQRGIEPCGPAGCSLDESPEELLPRWSSARQQPVLRLRGGADGCAGAVCEPPTRDMDSLIAELGHEFARDRELRTPALGPSLGGGDARHRPGRPGHHSLASNVVHRAVGPQ